VIAEPPVLPGAVQFTVAEVLPRVAGRIVGAPGTVGAAVGVTAFDGAEAAPLPTALLAVTAKVYAVPAVRPVTVIGLVVPDVAVPVATPPTRGCTEKPVIGDPPLLAGAVKLTTADVMPATADTAVGAPGAVAAGGAVGVTVFDEAEKAPVPNALVAATRRV